MRQRARKLWGTVAIIGLLVVVMLPCVPVQLSDTLTMAIPNASETMRKLPARASCPAGLG